MEGKMKEGIEGKMDGRMAGEKCDDERMEVG